MTEMEWFDTYEPVRNHLSKNPSGDLFETYGIELGYVLGVADSTPARVWTLVEGDEGTYIISGYHLVNRLGYYITKKPFEGEFLEVLDHLYEDEEEDETI